MRIAYVLTRSDATGGASVHVRDLASQMVAEGHQVEVLIGGNGQVADELRRTGLSVTCLQHLRRTLNPIRDARAYREMIGRLKELRPDLVSTHTAKAGWLGRAACSRLGIPALYTPHGWTITDRISRHQGQVYAVAERIAARWCDAIVCVCDAERRIALDRRVGKPRQLHVIHNGVKDIDDRLRASPAASPPTLVSIARFEAPKDHSFLVMTLAGLQDLDWNLVLVGDGPLLGAVRQLAGELGIGGRVRFPGYLTDPAEAMSTAQMFVLSSRSEGFPRSILEAMRAGLPVVASDVGGVREAVEDGINGSVFPHGHLDSLRRALRDLIESPLNRERFGQAGRQLFEIRFGFDQMVRATQNLYVSVIGERRRP